MYFFEIRVLCNFKSRAGPEWNAAKRMTVGTRYAGFPVTLIKIILGGNGQSDRPREGCRTTDRRSHRSR